MRTRHMIRFFMLIYCVVLASCSSMPSETSSAANGISADAVWIDVRTVEEYANDHIDGDMNVPIQTLDPATLAAQLGLQSDSEIVFYCASGGRAGRAKTMLEEAGFTNVINAGGIDDARELRRFK